MVSNFPRHLSLPGELAPHRDATAREDGVGDRVLGRIRQAFCGLHGHDSLLQFEQDRLFLKCVSCGHESPGWNLTEGRQVRSAEPDSEEPFANQPMIDARRIA